MDSNAMDISDNDLKENGVIDEDLYSRQLYVLGHEAMMKMQKSSVLIVGLNGLGIEIAKNVILAGVKSVALLDNDPVQIGDLSSQFYLVPADIGKPRAAACVKKLTDLNRYVPVSVVEDKLNRELLEKSRYEVVVLINVPFAEQLEIDDLCREIGTKLICADCCGLLGTIFVDNGPNFTVSDVDGEPPLTAIIESVSQDAESVVTVMDESRHGLSDGHYVTFSEVEGMTELNGAEFKIKYIGPYAFSIGDTSTFSKYTSGGRFDQVKKPEIVHFKSLRESSAISADFMVTDFVKMDHPAQLHVLYLALSEFRVATGHHPRPHTTQDRDQVCQIAARIAAALPTPITLDDKLIPRLARCASAVISPMAAAIGGMAAQEVLKSCSGKFMPIKQHLYFDAVECLPTEDLPLEEYQPLNTRYDDQIAVFGKSLQQKLSNLRYFLVGAGAIGCEMLKNWAMMGVASGEKGQITVTDMDSIEKSNLNRQFLFRNRDVTKLKSKAAAAAIQAMNPEIRIVAHANRVGSESENVYNDSFWNSLTGVCTALDNVDARLYVDQKCVYYQKPMLESGTLGTKGNTQIVIPHLTESYGSSRDPPEKSIPICTLKNFPNKIEHTIQWARDQFEGWFKQAPDDVNSYLSSENFLDELAKQQNIQLETLRTIGLSLVDERPSGFDQCIEWARFKFEVEFANNISQLLHAFPADTVTATGTKFWSGPKRAPAVVTFDANDEVHMDYIISAANLRAFNYELNGRDDVDYFKTVLEKVSVPTFVPKKDFHVATTEEEMKKQEEEAVPENLFDEADRLAKRLPQPSSLVGYRLSPCEFEKDNPKNFHIAFITACANLRARNYSIKEVSRHECKLIAGKIIPAIATTTAMVTGLVCLELYKTIQDKPLEAYKNGFANLAIPFLTFGEPVPPVKTKSKLRGKEWEYTLWDRIDIDQGDITLQKFLDLFSEEYGFDVSMLSYGPSILYSFFANPKKVKQRKKKPMSKVAEEVSKTKLRDDERYLILEACVTDENDEDVEIPYIRLKFR
uniref:E1 ubiquitin-activating enzyme n=1 Tax=Hirondellea gigas TaxID=1518452 RepID=A0A6A7G6M5_9CRUS